MVERPLPPETDVPPGWVWEAHTDPVWAVHGASHPASRPCRYTVGPGHRTCKAPGVAAVIRGTLRKSVWWYCADHLYGGWIEDGQVMNWRLVELEGEDRG